MRVMMQVLLVSVCLTAVALGQERRAPSMGFMGMRGKKDGDELKRAPMLGFQGVRGKKDDMEMDRAPSFIGLQDLREKDDFNMEEEKRAPSLSGFQGVRGKKDEMDKRAPAMGFVGMRGKKDYDYFWLPEEDKRAPSGFFGMRGKKGPSSGFFGMRGKKGPSGFFGMRGKKVPSGFLGVRGKKDNPDDLDALLQFLRESAAREEIEEMLDSRAKRFANYLDNSKDDEVLNEDANLL